jgi:hypothetical protein
MENDESKTVEENLIMVPKKNSSKLCIPWLKLGVLLLVWFSFFSIYLLRGNGYGQVKLLSFFLNLHGPTLMLLMIN